MGDLYGGEVVRTGLSKAGAALESVCPLNSVVTGACVEIIGDTCRFGRDPVWKSVSGGELGYQKRGELSTTFRVVTPADCRWHGAYKCRQNIQFRPEVFVWH